MRKDTRAGARRRGYDKAHEKWRAEVLAREPNCRMCGGPGLPNDHADHIVPIRKGGARFDPANGQRLCTTCHNGAKQRLEKSGELVIRSGCDANGIPLGNHHWNQP